MARILISEPHEQVRLLLARVVTRLGHEPAIAMAPTPHCFESVDVFMVEPAAPIGAVLAKAARLIDPALPIVCVSVAAPPEIDVEFAACVVKPFTPEQLRDAIERALAKRANAKGARSRFAA
jgi:DNA-binding NtrC family response regulator